MLDKLNPAEWARQKERAKKQLELVAAYKATFSGPVGEKVLLDLMSNHGVMSSTFDVDERKHAFQEGERNVVLRIMKLLGVDEKETLERIARYEREMV